MGHVKAGSLTLACALGRTGVTYAKREGDKATPAGTMRLLHGYYRSDRMARPFCRIPLRPLTRDLGWCDEPNAPIYNRPDASPMRVSHEKMWRTDGLYDVVFVLDYNIAPRRRSRGSAIFLHCAKPSLTTKPVPTKLGPLRVGLNPTLGCVALRPEDMRRLLGRLAHNARLTVV